jgi:predicted SprT family Zn-dependent metalloprotease
LHRPAGPPRWVGFNRRKQALGLCVYARRAIEPSVHLVERNGAGEVPDTLPHEVAHAFAGPGRRHDAVWKRKCLEVGARPRRCGPAGRPEGRWRARCGACGRVFHRHRRPAGCDGWVCRRCGLEPGGLVWEDE